MYKDKIKKGYLEKVSQYRQKYGSQFDPAKLPQYLHSIDDFEKGYLGGAKHDFDANRRNRSSRSPASNGRASRRIKTSRSRSPSRDRKLSYRRRSRSSSRSLSRSPVRRHRRKSRSSSADSSSPSRRRRSRSRSRNRGRSPARFRRRGSPRSSSPLPPSRSIKKEEPSSDSYERRLPNVEEPNHSLPNNKTKIQQQAYVPMNETSSVGSVAIINGTHPSSYNFPTNVNIPQPASFLGNLVSAPPHLSQPFATTTIPQPIVQANSHAALLSTPYQPCPQSQPQFYHQPELISQQPPPPQTQFQGQISQQQQQQPQFMSQRSVLLSNPVQLPQQSQPVGVPTPVPAPVLTPKYNPTNGIPPRMLSLSTSGSGRLSLIESPPDANSLLKVDSISESRQLYFQTTKTVYFTPCIKTLLKNIQNCWKNINFTQQFLGNLETFHSEEIIAAELPRVMEAVGLIGAAQSLFYSVKSNHTAICTFLERAEIPFLSDYLQIMAQYGDAHCERTGETLTAIDHESDIRAILRAVHQIVPVHSKVALSEVEVQNIVARSWLPTSLNDKRFYWILSCRLSQLLQRRLDYTIPVKRLLDAFMNKQLPLWWNNADISQVHQSRLNFLFKPTWTLEDFLENLGRDYVGRALLDGLDLEWPPDEASLEHFAFVPTTNTLTFKLNPTVSRVYKKYNLFFQVNGFPTNPNTNCKITMKSVSANHQGSWFQVSTKSFVDNKMILTAVDRGESAAQKKTALLFHPAAICDHTQLGN